MYISKSYLCICTDLIFSCLLLGVSTLTYHRHHEQRVLLEAGGAWQPPAGCSGGISSERGAPAGSHDGFGGGGRGRAPTGGQQLPTDATSRVGSGQW